MNLVKNAAESMPRGGKVQVGAHACSLEAPEKLRVAVQGTDAVPPGDYVVLSVADAGTGIEPEALELIFEPFYTRKVMGRGGPCLFKPFPPTIPGSTRIYPVR